MRLIAPTLMVTLISAGISLAVECPNGFSLRGYEDCVAVVTAPQTWMEAKQTCLSLHPKAVLFSPGGYLDVITELRFKSHWMGISDKESEGLWLRESGEVLDALPWAAGEPSDGKSNGPATSENCVRSEFGAMYDEPCHSSKVKLPFACTVSLEQLTAVKQENAKCSKGWTEGKNACYFLVPGAKQKSWNAARDACRKIDRFAVPVLKKNSADSGITPNLEGPTLAQKKLFWLDPSNQGSLCKLLYFFKGRPRNVYSICKSETWAYTLCQKDFCMKKCCEGGTHYQGRCNLVVKKPLTRPEAAQYCKGVFSGAHLATVRTMEENDFLVSLAAPGGVAAGREQHFWIGLFRKSCTCAWAWEDKSPVDCAPWGKKDKDARWTTLELQQGKWTGWKKQANKFPFICQWREC